MNVLIKKTLEDFRNCVRLTDYEARKEAFIKEWGRYPDNDYSAYYGQQEAAYIDARSNFYWWKEQDQDEQWIEEQGINSLKEQAF